MQASAGAAAARPPTGRLWRRLAIAMIVLAVVPIGAIGLGLIGVNQDALEDLTHEQLFAVSEDVRHVLAGDDELLFGSRNGFYVTASANDPTTWSELPMPAFPDPGYITTWDLKYDADHRVLYSLNSRNGFWRLLVP